MGSELGLRWGMGIKDLDWDGVPDCKGQGGIQDLLWWGHNLKKVEKIGSAAKGCGEN